MKVYEECLKEELLGCNVEDCPEVSNVVLEDYISYIIKFEEKGNEVVLNKVSGCKYQLYVNWKIFLTCIIGFFCDCIKCCYGKIHQCKQKK